MSQFRIYAAKIGSVFIRATTNNDIQDGITVDRTLVDGAVDPWTANVIDESPVITIETLDIAGALGVCGFNSTTGSVTIYGAKIDGAGRASGNVHEIVEAGTARIYPVQLSMPHGQHARLTFRVVPYSNSDTVPPLARKAIGALPAETLNSDRFSIGPVKVEAQDISGKTSVNIDFGITLDEQLGKYDGANWLKEALLLSRQPRVTVSTVNVGMRAFTMGTASTDRVGAVPITTTATIFARKRNNTGYVANATEEHVSFVINNGIVYPIGQTGNPVQYTFGIDPFADASNAPIIIDTTAAIS
jgi:hypothetical protein